MIEVSRGVKLESTSCFWGFYAATKLCKGDRRLPGLWRFRYSYNPTEPGDRGQLPPQIFVGIEAKLPSSKGLRLLFVPSDFQIFLRPCSTVPPEQLLLQPSLSTSLCNCAIKVVGIKGFHLLSYYFFEQSFLHRRILVINWKNYFILSYSQIIH